MLPCESAIMVPDNLAGRRGTVVEIIDQTLLPHVFEVRQLRSVEDAAEAIRTMRVRGAPLIGATAAYGLALALHQDCSDDFFEASREMLPQPVQLRSTFSGPSMNWHVKWHRFPRT